MKILFIITLIGITKMYGQCPAPVTHLNGTVMVDDISVTVSSSGFITTDFLCGISPYIVGRNSEGVSGGGSYTFDFSPNIAGLSIDLTAINNYNQFN